MKRKLIALALALACWLVPGTLLAEKEETRLIIGVVGPKGRPVPKASVTITFVSGRKMLVKKVRSEWNTRTTSKGLAEFPEIPSGKVRLQVIASGYQTYGDEFEVSGEEMTHTVRLSRPKGQYSAHEPEPPPAEPEKKKPE